VGLGGFPGGGGGGGGGGGCEGGGGGGGCVEEGSEVDVGVIGAVGGDGAGEGV